MAKPKKTNKKAALKVKDLNAKQDPKGGISVTKPTDTASPILK